MGIAGVASALIGFGGAVTALGRQGSGQWSPAETLQVTALVNPCIVTLCAAFGPIGPGLVAANAVIVWRASNAAVFAGHTFGVAAFLRRGSPDTLSLAQTIWSAITVVVLLAISGSASGLLRWHPVTFSGLVLGMGVSLLNFYTLLVPANGVSIR